MNSFKKIIIISFLISYSSSNANLNIKDGSFIYNQSIFNFNADFNFTKTYNSRSNIRSYFGKGWCSELDRSIVASNDERIVLRSCYWSQDRTFVVEKSPLATSLGSLNREIAALKDVRFIHPITKERVIFSNGKYTFFQSNGEKYIFNRSGQIIEIYKSPIIQLNIKYYEQFITLSLNQSQSLVLFIKNHIISRVRGFNFEKSYIYESFLLKSEIDKKSKLKVSYDYNEFDNLISIQSGSERKYEVSYFKNLDTVSEILSKNCKVQVQYQNLSVSDIDYKASLIKSCDNKIINRSDYEFYHLFRTDGSKYLVKMRIRQNETLSEFNYESDGSYQVIQSLK